MTRSHAIFMQTMAKDLEAKITSSFASRIEGHFRTLSYPAGTVVEDEICEQKLAAGEVKYRPMKATTVGKCNETQTKESYFEDILARM